MEGKSGKYKEFSENWEVWNVTWGIKSWRTGSKVDCEKMRMQKSRATKNNKVQLRRLCMKKKGGHKNLITQKKVRNQEQTNQK